MNKVSQKKTKQGFTLIELLIVIGILAILVVTALLALNPAEAMKKSRDATRVKNLAELDGIIAQYLDSGVETSICSTGCSTDGKNTSCAAGAGTNWLKATNDLCQYAARIPIDPVNGQLKTFVNATGGLTSASIVYRVFGDLSNNYIICVRQEAMANASKVGGDDVDNDWLVTRSGANPTTLTSCNY